MPKVSVIIPLYNKVPYIERALLSVLKQTYQDFEIIVVDDGSTDGGAETVKSIKDERIRYVWQKNSGPGAARNKGISLSRSEMLTFLDADDEWEPEFLRSGVDILNRHQHLDFVFFDYYIYDEAKGIKRRRLYNDKINEGENHISRDCTPDILSSFISFMWTCAGVFRKRAVESIGGFYYKNHCTLGEDKYLWIKLSLNYKFYISKNILATYHIEASQLGHNREGPFIQTISLLDPDELYLKCPTEKVHILEGYLAIIAVNTCTWLALLGRGKEAKNLLEKYCSHYRPTGYLKAYLFTLISPLLQYAYRLYRLIRYRQYTRN